VFAVISACGGGIVKGKIKVKTGGSAVYLRVKLYALLEFSALLP
jgi:hypothetical protein